MKLSTLCTRLLRLRTYDNNDFLVGETCGMLNNEQKKGMVIIYCVYCSHCSHYPFLWLERMFDRIMSWKNSLANQQYGWEMGRYRVESSLNIGKGISKYYPLQFPGSKTDFTLYPYVSAIHKIDRNVKLAI